MPLDSVQSYDIFWKKANWKLKFSFLPRKSAISNKRIWFTNAYQGIAMYSGPFDSIFEFRWLTKEEYMFSRIRGKI